MQLEAGGETKSFGLGPLEITHLGIVEDLVEAIAEERPNCVPGDEGLKTTKVIEAAYRSSRERTVVAV